MAKELPYFQFEPAEYLTKNISFCSIAAQGLFINICSYYWQRNCELTKEQILRRLNHPNELQELIDESIISIEDNKITIKFLDNQRIEAIEKSNKAKTSAKKRWNNKQNTSERNANASKTHKQNTSERNAIRKDNIRKDKNIEEYKQTFDSFRKKYKGKKRGLDEEFNNFCKKHKDWKEVLPTLENILSLQIKEREKDKAAGRFVAEWKMLSTWINKRCWTEEISDTKEMTEREKDLYFLRQQYGN